MTKPPPARNLSEEIDYLAQKIADPETRHRYKEAALDSLEFYIDRVLESVRRVSDLLRLAHEVEATTFHVTFSSNSGPPAQDILRAAVVLTHAHLEDFLRTMARALLPLADSRTLNDIPLAGLGPLPKKFFLGELAQHRGKLVDDLIEDSVAVHLDQRSLNNINDIAQLLREMSFDPAAFNEHFPNIQEMILRRHQIVHHADRVKLPNSETYTPQPIEQTEVHTWLSATFELMKDLTRKLLPKLHPLGELEKSLDAGPTAK
jgi:HAMP domain-containing protein